MVGTLPDVAGFIREMAASKQAILAKAAQKKRQLQAFTTEEQGDQHTNFNAKMIELTPEQKQAYRVRNLQVDYQFAVRKLRQKWG